MEKKNDETKTGYEDTGEKDEFGQTGDKNIADLGGKETKETKETKPEKKSGDETSDDKLKEKKQEEITQENLVDHEDEMIGFLKDKKKEEEDPDKKKEEEEKEKKNKKKEGEEDGPGDDVFDIPEDDIKKVGTKAAEQQLNFSYQELAKEIGPEFEIGENSREAFVEGYKKWHEEAKTTVDFDLSAFTEDQKEWIKYFQGGGKVKDLYDPMVSYNNWLGQSSEDKLKDHLIKEKKFSKEEVTTEIEKMREEGSFDETVNRLNDRVIKARDNAYDSLIEETNKKYDGQAQQTQEIKKQQVAEIVKVINEMKTFMGFKLNDPTKKHLLLEVKTGRFAETVKTPEAQLYGRMYGLFGSKLLEKLKEAKKDDNRAGYNKGKEEIQKNLHHIETKQVSPTGVTGDKKFEVDEANPLSAFIEAAEDEIVVDEV